MHPLKETMVRGISKQSILGLTSPTSPAFPFSENKKKGVCLEHASAEYLQHISLIGQQCKKCAVSSQMDSLLVLKLGLPQLYTL